MTLKHLKLDYINTFIILKCWSELNKWSRYLQPDFVLLRNIPVFTKVTWKWYSLRKITTIKYSLNTWITIFISVIFSNHSWALVSRYVGSVTTLKPLIVGGWWIKSRGAGLMQEISSLRLSIKVKAGAHTRCWLNPGWLWPTAWWQTVFGRLAAYWLWQTVYWLNLANWQLSVFSKPAADRVRSTGFGLTLRNSLIWWL